MKTDELVAFIQANRWYRQAVSANPYYGYAPFFAYLELMGPLNCFAYFGKNFHEGYFHLERSFEMARETLRRAKSDRAYIDRVHAEWSGLTDAYEQKVGQANGGLLQTMAEGDFIEFQKDLLQSWVKPWLVALYVEPFDPAGETLLNEEVGASGIQLSQEEIEIMVTPREPLFHSWFEAELAQIALDHLAGKQRLTKIRTEQEYMASRIEALATLHEQTHWRKNDWGNAVPVSEYETFLECVLLLQRTPEELKQIVKRVKETPERIGKKQREIIDMHAMPESLDNVFYLFSEMTLFRDKRKCSVLKTVSALDAMLGYMSKRTGLSKELLRNVDVAELTSLGFSAEYEALLQQREQGVMWFSGKDGSYQRLVSDECSALHSVLDETFRQQHKEIKGTVGCKGKATGTARIINNTSDFHKMQDGDILVAPMTRPEYVPLMKKAAAIVTDEGGMSCHAALVSRELGVPCIIGTQVATKELQDGMQVQVNANNGSVTIMKASA